MACVNRHEVFPLDIYPEVSACGLELPKGELLHLSINPFNGNVVVAWQDNPCARFFLFEALRQLQADYPDFPLPGWSRIPPVVLPVTALAQLSEQD